MVVHTFNPSTRAVWRQRQVDLWEFQACLIYIMSSRPLMNSRSAKAAQCDSVSNKIKQIKENKRRKRRKV